MGTAKRKSNFCVNRSAKQHRCLVPVALRAPAPGYAGRWASELRPLWRGGMCVR